MGALIAGYCAAAFFLGLSLLGRSRRSQRQLAEVDHERAADLRRFAESGWVTYVLGSWSFLALVAGIFLLVRDHTIGWAWFGVAALYSVALALAQQNRQRILATLGDRGRVERPPRYRRRAATSNRWLVGAFTSYVASGVVTRAYPEGTPDGIYAVHWGLTLLTYACGLVFVILRVRMWLQGDNSPRPEQSRASGGVNPTAR